MGMQGHCALTNKREIPATLPGFQSRFIDPLLHLDPSARRCTRIIAPAKPGAAKKDSNPRQSLIPSWRRCSCQFCSDRLFGVICRCWATECIDQIARPSLTRRAVLPNPRHEIGSNMRHEIRATVGQPAVIISTSTKMARHTTPTCCRCSGIRPSPANRLSIEWRSWRSGGRL